MTFCNNCGVLIPKTFKFNGKTSYLSKSLSAHVDKMLMHFCNVTCFNHFMGYDTTHAIIFKFEGDIIYEGLI